MTNEIFMYCLALAMQKTGVHVHAACVMSNHHHLVVSDPRGELPNFLRELHRLTAKAMNASQGMWENFWAAEPCNVVRLVTDDDVADKIAYVAANPVAAGLVAHPEEWPGFLAWREQKFRVRRPSAYFREAGDCPDELTLSLDVPMNKEDVSEPMHERIARRVQDSVEEARLAIRRAGRSFMGRAAVLAASFVTRATSFEEKRGGIPTFAARLEAVREQLRRVERHFRARYRSALELWRLGQRGAVFPFGTWWMCLAHAAIVDSALPA